MEDLWWFKSLGEEFGPLGFDELVEAVRAKALLPADFVRHGRDGPWQKGSAVAGLFSPAKAAAEVSKPPADAVWMVEAVGKEIGPLSLAEIATMIRERKLLPDDRLRGLHAAEWFTIGTILERWKRAGAQRGQPAGGGHAGSSPSASAPAGSTPSASVLSVSAQARGVAAPEHATAHGAAAAQPPSAAQVISTPAVDDLESLILNVLGAHEENKAKPTLVELGLAAEAAATQAVAVTSVAERTLPSAPAARQHVATSGGNRWGKLNPFRRETPGGEQVATAVEDVGAVEEAARDDDGGSGATILAPIERSFTKPDAQAREGGSARPVRRAPWMELALAIGGGVLVVQLLPANVQRDLYDMTHWGWRGWATAQGVIVGVLLTVVIWQRRKANA